MGKAIEIRKVSFNEDVVEAFQERGVVYCVVKKTCENLGIKYKTQHLRIQKDPVLNQLSRLWGTVADDGKVREMLCLNKQGYLLWLAKINVGKVPNPDSLIDYQLKVAQVLEEYFFGNAQQFYRDAQRENYLVKRNKKLSYFAGKYGREIQKNNKELQDLRIGRLLRLNL